MNKLQASLSFAVLALALSQGAEAEAQQIPDTREYSRRGEISPNTTAPSIAQMIATIQSGSPESLKATLEYGERVVCQECVPLLEKKLLDSGVPRVREMSAWWLRRQPFAAPALVMRLRKLVRTDADPVRRARAAEALGEFMDPFAVGELSDAAMADTDPKVRVAAVHAIARLNNDAGFAVLTDTLSDADTTVKIATLDELVNIGAFRDHGALIALLGDTNAEVRTRAARLCGEYRVAEAQTTLIAMLEGDSASQARKAAAWALGRVGAAEGQSALAEASGREQEQGVLDAIRIAQRMPLRL
ncbi:MAG: HEAT repeat domain-containing protein [Myxococcales bacterium]